MSCLWYLGKIVIDKYKKVNFLVIFFKKNVDFLNVYFLFKKLFVFSFILYIYDFFRKMIYKRDKFIFW